MAHITITSDHDPWALIGLRLVVDDPEAPYWAGKCSCGWDLITDRARQRRTPDLGEAAGLAGNHVDKCSPDRTTSAADQFGDDLPTTLVRLVEAVEAVDPQAGKRMGLLLDGRDPVATLAAIRAASWTPEVGELVDELLDPFGYQCDRCRQWAAQVDWATGLCRVCDHHDDGRVVI